MVWTRSYFLIGSESGHEISCPESVFVKKFESSLELPRQIYFNSRFTERSLTANLEAIFKIALWSIKVKFLGHIADLLVK